MGKPVNRTLEIAAIGKDASGIGHVAGPVVTFRGKGDPLRSLVVGIKPVQDLHGYDNPWPAGGGKNLLPPGSSQEINGITAVWNSDGSVTFSGTATANVNIDIPLVIPAGTTVTFSANNASSISAGSRFMLIEDDNTTHQRYLSGDYVTATWTLNEASRTARYNVASGYSVSGTLYPQIEVGSTATSYAPYSNICPISGWSEVNVWRTGANVFDKSAVSINKWLSTTSGLEESASGYDVSDYIPVKANVPVFIPRAGTSRRWFYDKDKKPTTYLNNSNDQVFTPTQDGFIRITALVLGGGQIDLDAYQVEYGSTATPYEPYSGNQYTLALGQTVYGGTPDVVGGVLTVDRAMVDLGTLTWAHRAEVASGVFSCSAFTDYLHSASVNALCSSYAYKGTVASGLLVPQKGDKVVCLYYTTVDPTASSLYVYDTAYTDAVTFKAAMSGVQLVYELATPITIPLTPTEVTTLLGQNNVWADTGDVDVEYSASGGPGGKLAILLRERRELLIALKMGMTQEEAGLLGSLPGMSLGSGLSPGIIRPGASAQDEDEEEIL